MSKVLKRPSEYERIVAVVDLFDALLYPSDLTNYKPYFSPGESFTIIKNGRGMHFDPDIIDAITVQDLDGCILAWNPGAVRMYGWSEAEALAMNVREPDPEEAARGNVGHGTYA